MSIRKFGTEPAKVVVKNDDNDPETLASVAGWATGDGGVIPQRQDRPRTDRDDDDGQTYSLPS